MPKPSEISNITVQSSTVVGSSYAQLVGVVVTDVDITYEFVYLNPRKPDEGNIVSRITMPISTAQEFSNVISETIKNHDKSKSSK